MHALGASASRALHASDIHTALAPRDDARVLAALRGAEETQSIKAALAVAAERLNALPLPPGQARRVRRLLGAVSRDLNALDNGVPFGRRLLPWAAAMVAVSLPLPIPFYTGQRKFSSLQVAARVKDVMLLLGLLARDTSTPRAFGRHVENRVFLDLAATGIYAGPAFIDSARHLMSDLRFNIPATLAIAGSSLLYFNRHKLPSLGRSLRACVGCSPAAPQSARAGQEIRAWAASLEEEKTRLHTLLQNCQDNTPKALSDNLNRVLNQLAASFQGIAEELATCLPQEPARARAQNLDLYPKLAVALFALMIAGSLGAFLHQEISALVDLCARGVWIFTELAKAALDPAVNLQGILQTFKEISGLALLLLGYLSANEAIGFLDQGARDFWIGTAALSLGNITLPGPVATVVSQGLGRVLEACHRRPDHTSRADSGEGLDTIAAPQAPSSS
jgi:hypothetical protein